MRALGISMCSILLTTIVVGNAYYQKKQFYPSVVYITKSNPSMAVIYIQAFILVLVLGKIMGKIFFGQLRTAEFEHLMERAWYAITETCLAFTVFRDDFNPKFVALFTLLLFLKSFHWLAEDRVDYMERSPVISWLFHMRILSLLIVLGAFDLYFVDHAYQSTVAKGASVQLVFGFEYAILLSMVVNTTIKYVLHTIDLNSETPWENKAVLLLYTELVMGFIKVILYIVFVMIMMKIYTLPLFAFRPMYYTIRNFHKAFNDVILSRRAIYNMNTLYPDATREELEAADNVCIICREEMTSASKKLPCNHIFHTACLRSWFQRQQTCPTCRLNILRNTTAPPPVRPEQRPRVPDGVGRNGFMGPNPFANFPNFIGPNPFQNLMNGNGGGAAPAQEPAAQPPTEGTPTTSAQPSTSTVPPPPPPSFAPFVPFPFMAMPPFPPPNLRQLTVEELRRMEGNERENIEMRIQCLKNIQVMLDTAVSMMQQYSLAASMSTSMPMPSTSRDKNTPNGVPSTNETVEDGQEGSSSDLPNSEGDEASHEEEIRKRRLQRFQVEEQQPQ